MAHISEFSGEEAARLIALPFMVGMYISHADDEEGEGDDKKEIAALKSCIKAVADTYEDGSFIRSVVEQTMQSRDQWSDWNARAFHAPSEAQQAIVTLKATVPEPDLKAYRALLIEIATTVAQAHGEFSSFDEDDAQSGFGALVGKIVSGFSSKDKDDAGHPMNISASEDSAIETLKDALR